MEQNIEPNMFGEQLGEEEIFDLTFANQVDEQTIKLIDSFGVEKEPKEDSKGILQKALKGIQVAISLAGKTRDLIKAKKGIEIAISLI